MRVKLFCDEDFYVGKFAPDIRRLGYDVVDVLDVGLIGNPDDALLGCAINNKRAFLTFNRRHFVRIPKAEGVGERSEHKKYMDMGKEHWGIIYSRRGRLSYDEVKARVRRLVESCTAEYLRNQLINLSQFK